MTAASELLDEAVTNSRPDAQSHELPSLLPSFHLLAQTGKVEEVLGRLEAGEKVDQRDKQGHTALHCAAGFNQVKIVELLLVWGADVEVKNDMGYTPLHVAAHNGKHEVVSTLLANNADVMATDQKGQTPLQVTKRDDPAEVLDFQNGLDNLEPADGQDGLSKVSKMLLEASKEAEAINEVNKILEREKNGPRCDSPFRWLLRTRTPKSSSVSVKGDEESERIVHEFMEETEERRLSTPVVPPRDEDLKEVDQMLQEVGTPKKEVKRDASLT